MLCVARSCGLLPSMLSDLREILCASCVQQTVEDAKFRENWLNDSPFSERKLFFLVFRVFIDRYDEIRCGGSVWCDWTGVTFRENPCFESQNFLRSLNKVFPLRTTTHNITRVTDYVQGQGGGVRVYDCAVWCQVRIGRASDRISAVDEVYCRKEGAIRKQCIWWEEQAALCGYPKRRCLQGVTAAAVATAKPMLLL